jgi:argininosuccinate lyase / amino-acid N-acetyltransferase
LAGNKLWGGRFASGPDRLFAELNDSLSFDRELLEVDIRGSVAYSHALERAGVFSGKERRRVQRALHSILDEHRRNPALIERSRAEDVHTWVEQALAAKVGDLALRLHTGRSRNDQVATDLRLYLMDKVAALEIALNRLLEALADLAQRNLAAVLPGYTHLQRAQPVLFSHYLLAYGAMFLRDRDRLRETVARTRVCPLGSGAISGTIYKIDREALARELGFDSVSDNSMDAVSDRDFVLDFLFFASMLMTHLSRLSEDLILYSSAEFGFLQMHDSVSSGSSLMPQKKNPDAAELVRGKTGRVVGHLVALLTVMKGLPMAYNKDLQEDKEGLFDTVRTLEKSIPLMSLVLQRLQIHSDPMRRAATQGHLNATELADFLVARNMPFRKAHELAGKIVLYASERNCRLEDLRLSEFRRFSRRFTPELYQSLQVDPSLARRRERGGTAPAQVRRALQRFRRQIGEQKTNR